MSILLVLSYIIIHYFIKLVRHFSKFIYEAMYSIKEFLQFHYTNISLNDYINYIFKNTLDTIHAIIMISRWSYNL